MTDFLSFLASVWQSLIQRLGSYEIISGVSILGVMVASFVFALLVKFFLLKAH